MRFERGSRGAANGVTARLQQLHVLGPGYSLVRGSLWALALGLSQAMQCGWEFQRSVLKIAIGLLGLSRRY